MLTIFLRHNTNRRFCLYSPADPGFFSRGVAHDTRIWCVVSIADDPEIDPQVVDFTSTASVTLLSYKGKGSPAAKKKQKGSEEACLLLNLPHLCRDIIFYRLPSFPRRLFLADVTSIPDVVSDADADEPIKN